MDVVSAVSSIASIADIVLGLLSNLNRYYRSFSNASTRSKELRDRVNSLLDIISDVQESLEKGRSPGPPPPEFQTIKRWLSQLETRTSPQSTRGIHALSWPFREEEINKIITEIDLLKGDLNTRIATQTLYLLLDLDMLTSSRRGVNQIAYKVGDIHDTVHRNDRGCI